MHRIAASCAIALAALPLLAAVPASKVKEPNAVFVFGAQEGGVTATLFDRQKRKVLDVLDAKTDLPLQTSVSINSNDAMQFSPATGKIYALVHNFNDYDGSILEESLPYAAAIIETDFEFSEPTTIFSCDDCRIEQWTVHPTKPALYVSLADVYKQGADEFRNAKLVEVTLSPKRRTRVLARIPSYSALRVTPDGKEVFVFGQALRSRNPYGALVRVNLSNRKRTQTIVNFPIKNAFDLAVSPLSADVSPDALEMAYHMSVIDVRTAETEKLIEDTRYELDNFTIGWSRDSNKLLFQLMEAGGIDERVEVPLLYERSKDREWILPLQDVNFLDWAPAQTAILFSKRGDIGFYDLTKREWVFVAEGQDGSWVTLPTKRVPKH